MGFKELNGGLEGNQEVTIGIDQSLTGFALSVVSVNSPTQHITWVYKSPYNGVQRLADITSWIQGRFIDQVSKGNVILDVAMEGTVLASQSALVLGELSATVKLALYDIDRILPLQVPPMTLKKYATGKGTAKKQEMLLQIYKRWGVEFNDDNAADAYALARLAAGIATDNVEKEVVEKLQDPKFRDTIL